MSKKRVILVWFRNDLRLHDNEILREAIDKADLVIPVYFFDPRYFRVNSFGYKNTGALRAQFLLESVAELKNSFMALNSDLLTFHDYPENILPRLVAKYEVDEVFHHREVAHRETKISEKVEIAIWQSNHVNLRHFIGHTIYHKEDLPFPIKDIPDSFSMFRKKIERESKVRGVLPTPTEIISPQHFEKTSLPTLEELGYSEGEIKLTETKKIIGGEKQGLSLLNEILGNEGTDVDFENIFPYISSGCISPILVYQEILKVSQPVDRKKTDKKITFLLWRDYFRFMLKKHPNVFFKINGKLTDEDHSREHIDDLVSLENLDHEIIRSFVDKAIFTGLLPYDERIIFGRYIIEETSCSWLRAASFMEQHLLDYTPATHYGLWSHIAGIGTSTKDNLSDSWKKLFTKNFPEYSEKV